MLTPQFFIGLCLGTIAFILVDKFMGALYSFRIIKLAEMRSLMILLELHAARHQSKQVLQLVYEEAGRLEELEKINKSIDKRYDEVNERIFKTLQNYLPYKVKYKNLQEAARYVEDIKKMIKEINNAR
jgi:hypothetical protein